MHNECSRYGRRAAGVSELTECIKFLPLEICPIELRREKVWVRKKVFNEKVFLHSIKDFLTFHLWPQVLESLLLEQRSVLGVVPGFAGILRNQVIPPHYWSIHIEIEINLV